MQVLLKDIEELKLSNTEEKIICLIDCNSVLLKELTNDLNVIFPTIIKESRKLQNKQIIEIEEGKIHLTQLGLKVLNFYKFRNKILLDFCEVNKLEKNIYNQFINSKKYNNLNLLLGIKNLLKKETS